MEDKVILVTGGAGFLGSHLCDHYIKTGKVICVDNLSTGSRKNIQHLINNKNFIFIEADITDELPDSILQHSYSTILNMASPASPPHYQRLALETLLVGSVGTKNVLELARRDKARFFHASTSEVYGDPEVHPQPESYKGSVNCYGPRAMYDESKRFSEAMIYVYHNDYKVNTCIARFFNTYGPRMDKNDGRVVSNFIVQALKNKNISVHGDGTQTRSFCFVDDLIKGIVALIDSNEHDPINLGNPSEFTIAELARIVIDMTGSTSTLTYHPLPKDDPTQRKPVIENATTRLKWSPKINLNDGLKRTIEFFNNEI